MTESQKLNPYTPSVRTYGRQKIAQKCTISVFGLMLAGALGNHIAIYWGFTDFWQWRLRHGLPASLFLWGLMFFACALCWGVLCLFRNCNKLPAKCLGGLLLPSAIAFFTLKVLRSHSDDLMPYMLFLLPLTQAFLVGFMIDSVTELPKVILIGVACAFGCLVALFHIYAAVNIT